MFSQQLRMTLALAVCILAGSESVLAEEVSSTPAPLNIKAVAANQPIQEFFIGDPKAERKAHVRVYEKTQTPLLSTQQLKSVPQGNSAETTPSSAQSQPNFKRDPQGRIIIDMTPSECTSQSCYDGAFQPPEKADCDAIVQAQLYNSTGSLTAYPGTFVYVSTGTCAVVFQNPNPKASYTLDYNWAKLGLNVQNILNKCFQSTQKSIGGICEIKHYLNYTLDNVGISLQRISNPA